MVHEGEGWVVKGASKRYVWISICVGHNGMEVGLPNVFDNQRAAKADAKLWQERITEYASNYKGSAWVRQCLMKQKVKWVRLELEHRYVIR
jgi:hypothetical protein